MRAKATERSKALATEPVKAYLDVNEWQTQAVQEAVKKAERRGAKFIDHEKVDAWLATWGRPHERPFKP